MSDPLQFEDFMRQYQDMVFTTAWRLVGREADVAHAASYREDIQCQADGPAGWVVVDEDEFGAPVLFAMLGAVLVPGPVAPAAAAWQDALALGRILASQPEACLECERGCLTDVADFSRGEPQRYRRIVCLEGVADPLQPPARR